MRDRAIAEISETSDAQALAAVAQGETAALGVLYVRHQRSIERFLYHAAPQAFDREDLVHEVFLTAARAAKSFDGRESCRPWLLGITAKLLQRRRRSSARWARMANLLVGVHQRWVEPHAYLEARDQLESLAEILARLSEPKRTVLLLAEVEGLTSEEIASALDVPVGTVWTRLHHARSEIRARLSKQERP